MKSRIYSFAFAAIVLFAASPQPCAAGDGYKGAIMVETLLKTGTDAAGQLLQFPQNGKAELATLLVEIPAGQDTGWHVHPNPCVAYILDGEVAVRTEGGAERAFKAGESFAEVVNLAHCGRNTGTKPVKILLIVAGQQGAPISRPVVR